MDMGRGKERVRYMERVTWKLTLPQVKQITNRICCMAQETQTGTLYQPREVGWGERWEGASKRRGYMCLFQFWFPQGICLGVGLLCHMVVLFLVFKGISIPSSIVAISINIPTNGAKSFPFLHTLSSIYCLQTFC